MHSTSVAIEPPPQAHHGTPASTLSGSSRVKRANDVWGHGPRATAGCCCGLSKAVSSICLIRHPGLKLRKNITKWLPFLTAYWTRDAKSRLESLDMEQVRVGTKSGKP